MLRHCASRALVLSVALLWPLAASALTLLTEDYPPFNMLEESRVGGISTLVLQDALKRSGINGKFALYPWARSLALARTQPDTCVYSAVRTPDREKQFKWAGPLVDDKIGLYARSESTIKLAKVADAKVYRVGGYVADAFGDYVEKQGVNLDRAPLDVLNLGKLVSGRIDLWVAGTVSGPYRAAREGYQGQIKLITTGGDPRDTQMWLACNPSVPNATIKLLNDAIKALNTDGTAAIYAKRYY